MGVIPPWIIHHILLARMVTCTLPSQWFRVPARLRVSTTATIEHIPADLSKKGAVIGAVLSTRNYTNQDYVHVNYTLIDFYSMLLVLVTGSQSKNVSCFCLDMAQ
jgi:hypothetical protein